ncbi:SagB family peptide dehydrogenase [Tumebacillus lipolyticus]|uniref:SagB family peptide dehydrogenase n=1 Tax=Tumebacillus lipolyticus TaxID=1280370 RepID=A0ABW4ZZF4_9BACL
MERRWLAASRRTSSVQERFESKRSGKMNPFHLAEVYHANSKFDPDLMSFQLPLEKYSVPDVMEEATDDYFDLPRFEELPPLTEAMGDVLLRRRSSWEFAEPIDRAELIVLLKYALGTNAVKTVADGTKEIQLRLRSYPSGGALYPVQFFLYVHQVRGMERGLYRFCPYLNRLYLHETGDFVEQIASMTASTDPNGNPGFIKQDYSRAAVHFFLAADFRHQSDKYGLRSYRLTLLEAGHAAQNIMLVSTALGMTGVTLAGFYDDRANELLKLDGVDRAALYMIPIGRAGGE